MILLDLLAWGALIALPGVLLARWLLPEEEAAPRLAFALALGAVVGAWAGWALAGLVGLVFRMHLHRGFLAASAWGAVALVAWRLRARGGGAPRPAPRGWTRFDVAALAIASAAGLLWLARLDPVFFTQHHCMPASAMLSVADTLSGHVPDLPPEAAGRNLSLLQRFGQREGAVALLATQVASFGLAGFRASLAFAGFLVSLAGYALGRAAGWDRRLALVLAAALPLSPHALAIHHPNPNLDAYALGAVALALAAGGGRRTPATLGALMALPATVVHFLLPAALLVPFALWGRGEGRAMRRYGLGLAVVLTPAVLAHAAMLFSDAPTVYESFQKYGAVEHCIAGLCFEWNGLLNWPFTAELLRDPYRAFPAALRFPLELVGSHGLLLSGAALVGVGLLVRRRRSLALLFAIWVLPAGLPLLLQANWVDRAKSGAVLPLLPPLAFAAFEAFRSLADAADRRRVGAMIALAGLALGGFVVAGSSTTFPVDERVFPLYAEDELAEAVPAPAPEVPAHVAADRHDVRRLALLPEMSRALWDGEARIARWAVSDLARDLRRPAPRDFEPPLADRLMHLIGVDGLVPPGVTIVARRAGGEASYAPPPLEDPTAIEVVVTLSSPLTAWDGFVREPSAEDAALPTLDVMDGPGVVATGLGAAWHGAAPALVALRSERATLLVLTNLRPDAVALARERGATPVDAGGAGSVRLRLPEGQALVIADLVSWEPAWDLTWLATSEPDGWSVRPAFRGYD